MNFKQKVKQFFSSTKGKVATAVAGVGSALAMPMTAFAADGAVANNEAINAIKSLLTTAQGSINITNIVSIVGAGIGAVLGLFLVWWGARKLVNMLVTVFKKGKVKL